jgi:hypothetical protein
LQRVSVESLLKTCRKRAFRDYSQIVALRQQRNRIDPRVSLDRENEVDRIS